MWFTQYNAGKIAKFDPATETFTEYDTSSKLSGPYAIWVDPFDNVWFSLTGIYKIGKFDQNTQTLYEYDLPSPKTHIKFIHTDDKGNVWFPNYNNNKIGVIFASTPTEEKVAPSTAEPKSEELGDPEQEVGLEDQVTNSAIAGITIAIIAIAAIVAFLRIRYKKQ